MLIPSGALWCSGWKGDCLLGTNPSVTDIEFAAKTSMELHLLAPVVTVVSRPLRLYLEEFGSMTALANK